MAEPNVNEIHDFLVDLSFKAGEIITNALLINGGTGSKKNSVSLRSRNFHQSQADSCSKVPTSLQSMTELSRTCCRRP